jgi:hypothetical protein
MFAISMSEYKKNIVGKSGGGHNEWHQKYKFTIERWF